VAETATRIGSVAGVAETSTRIGSVVGVAEIATRTSAHVGAEAFIILIDAGTATMMTVTGATAIIITGAGTRMTTTDNIGALEWIFQARDVRCEIGCRLAPSHVLHIG